MATRAGLANQDMEFVQFHPTGMCVCVFVSVTHDITLCMILSRDLRCWLSDHRGLSR